MESRGRVRIDKAVALLDYKPRFSVCRRDGFDWPVPAMGLHRRLSHSSSTVSQRIRGIKGVKIAVMMRAIDQDTGLGFFTDNLLRTLLRMDQDKFLSASLQGAETFRPLRKFCQRKGIAAAVEA